MGQVEDIAIFNDSMLKRKYGSHTYLRFSLTTVRAMNCVGTKSKKKKKLNFVYELLR